MMVGNTDCSPLEEETSLLSPLLPSSFVGYEWALFFLFSFFFLLFVIEFFCRRTLRKKHLVNPTKNPTSLPLTIPFQDPLFSFSSSLFNIFTGNEYKLRHPKYLLEMNMKSEEENNGCLCRQMSFLGWLMVISWDPDHFREVSTNNEDWGKIMGFSKIFDNISKRSILLVEGQEWKDQKRLIHPAFQFTHVKNQISKFNVIANRFVSKLSSLDGPVEMLPWTSKATLDGLSMAGFGIDMGALLEKNNEAYDLYSETMSRFEDPMTLLPFFELLPIEKNKKWLENIRLYMKYLSDLVGRKRLLLLEEERAGEEREGKDILDLLIAARDEDENTGLTDEELIHNVNMFYIAGHETSSSTLAFAAHMLAEHPEVQEKVYQEIQTVIGDREPSNEDFPSLKYTSAFLKEVQRLYPAAVGMARKAKKDLVLGKYHIPEGTMVMLSSYTIHRHPKYWERPDDFWPERFYPENSKGRHPFAYTPFSAGPRACIGKQFALIEMKILLIHLVQSFKVLKDSEQNGLLDAMGIVLRPAVGVKVILEKRM